MAEKDDLGLDKPLKLGKVLKIPKITDELIFDPVRGIPQISKNYRKLSRMIKKNDKKLHEKLRNGKSKLAARRMKVDAEVENLGSIVQFYQFWCHGFFPRANFNDCIRMLRTYKSAKLKEYRRGLIEHELHKLKVAKGIITEGDEQEDGGIQADDDDDLYTGPYVTDNGVPSSSSKQLAATLDLEEDDGDWDFMNVNLKSSNGLFIGDDDDDLAIERPKNPFQDEEIPPQHDIEDDHEAELEAMRSMGM